MKRPLAYITAPWSENEFENTENAAKYCRAVYDAGFSPVCPALFCRCSCAMRFRRSIKTASTWRGSICAALVCWWSAAASWMKA